jgi:hypothetical protein
VAKWGPYFGEGELGAWQEPFNETDYGLSMTYEQGYQLNTYELGKNPLTNLEGFYFTISELEIWHIEEIV